MVALPSRPLAALSRPGPLVLALLYSLESLARALLATVIPLQAYALLKDAARVSALFAVIGILGMAASFAIPALIRLTRRRHVYRLGGSALILAAALIWTATLPGQAAGMFTRLFGVACLSVTFNLYLMDLVGKRELVKAEPLRLSFSAAAWTLGPFLGVWMHERWGLGAATGTSAVCALLMLVYFQHLRLGERSVHRTLPTPVAPLAAIRRFVAQPRLRLGWILPFGRSCWWSVLFTYGPILMVARGASPQSGAALVSLANAMLFLSPLFGRLAMRIGVRPLMIASFLALAAGTIAAGLVQGALPAMALLLASSIGATVLDTTGNLPFLRAVRAHERTHMTTVFRTYIDLSDLIPAALFALLLQALPLGSVFVVTGAAMLAFALLARCAARHVEGPWGVGRCCPAGERTAKPWLGGTKGVGGGECSSGFTIAPCRWPTIAMPCGCWPSSPSPKAPSSRSRPTPC
jgi:MFS family permease